MTAGSPFATLPKQPVRLSPSWSQYLPFGLFFLLVCTPRFTTVGAVSLSIVLFPIVLYGYLGGARIAVQALVPGVRRIVLLLLALVIAFCGWALVTGIGADEFLRIFRPLYGHACGLAVVVALLALSRTEEAARRTRLLCLTMLTVCLALTLPLGSATFGDRYPGMFKHPNQLGQIATMGALYFFCLAMSSPRQKLFYPACGLLIAMYAVLLSGSKTNYIVFAGVSLLAVPALAFQNAQIAKINRELGRNLGLALGLLALGITILPLVSERSYEVLTTIADGDQEVDNYHSITDRSYLWHESWIAAERHPITGVGAGQPLPDGTEHSHNVFMDVMRTTGFPGLAIISAFILTVLWYIFGAYRTSLFLRRYPRYTLYSIDDRGHFTGALAAMLSYLLSNQMSDSFGPTTIPFFYMLLAFSVSFMIRRPAP